MSTIGNKHYSATSNHVCSMFPALQKSSWVHSKWVATRHVFMLLTYCCCLLKISMTCIWLHICRWCKQILCHWSMHPFYKHSYSHAMVLKVKNQQIFLLRLEKHALIFVEYLDDYCHMQKLSKDLPKWKKSSVVETCVLWKLGQVFTPEKGRTLDPPLFFSAHACHSTSQ
jgi:hypothetical protein